MSEVRAALLVGTQSYADAKFAGLWTPHNDVRSMTAVLADQEIGAYEVESLLDPTGRELSEALEGFCADASSADLRLLYLSCHGRRDNQGRLFFVCSDTLAHRLQSTGVDAGLLSRLLAESPCRRFLVFLDCCYSGAYSLDAKGAPVPTFAQLAGEGRAVYAATGELNEAYQEEPGELSLSVFTRAIVQGLRTGDADLNGDGTIGSDELYEYVVDEVRRVRPSQQPQRISKVKGSLAVASVPRRTLSFDPEVRARAVSEDPFERLLAAAEFRRHLATQANSAADSPGGAGDENLARLALLALIEMTNDSDPNVRSLVQGLVSRHQDPAPTRAPNSVEDNDQHPAWRQDAAETGASESVSALELPLDQQPGGSDWYRRAIFYDVLVTAFDDHNGDGQGDLRGLTRRLDYLQWLGVDCLCVGSLLANDGVGTTPGIVDFLKVDPNFGDLGDLVMLVDEAHKRGMRIVADLMMNSTSDMHPWFQASRSDPGGSFGDYYVWSDTDALYAEARVIYSDTEKSNWAWDPTREQYYWHRLRSRQPDLNYDHRAVQEAMIDVLTFWLDLGIDGVRLEGLPYLFRDEGTTCENLPRVHTYANRLRSALAADHADKLLLALADQQPNDLVAYFGTTDAPNEAHMAYHFPLMARMFMAVRRESRYPISEILAATPPIPRNCQWGIFLRNHDELPLETVTDEERDYMYSEYAKDPQMKSNVGIARRLAPLLENDRNQIELFTSLLLSLPGSPVLYYGDEIGMGDNIYLGDRDGVRTPMQWNADRNAGFSPADPQKLYLPMILDPVYGYQGLNVEAQMRSSSSLLQWTRKMLLVRKQHPVFGMGSYEELGASNPAILAFVREFGDDKVLCVNNLSRFPQPVEFDLRRFEGYLPVELTGLTHYPKIGKLPYLFMLPGHGFAWFGLVR